MARSQLDWNFSVLLVVVVSDDVLLDVFWFKFIFGILFTLVVGCWLDLLVAEEELLADLLVESVEEDLLTLFVKPEFDLKLFMLFIVLIECLLAVLFPESFFVDEAAEFVDNRLLLVDLTWFDLLLSVDTDFEFKFCTGLVDVELEDFNLFSIWAAALESSPFEACPVLFAVDELVWPLAVGLLPSALSFWIVSASLSRSE